MMRPPKRVRVYAVWNLPNNGHKTENRFVNFPEKRSLRQGQSWSLHPTNSSRLLSLPSLSSTPIHSIVPLTVTKSRFFTASVVAREAYDF